MTEPDITGTTRNQFEGAFQGPITHPLPRLRPLDPPRAGREGAAELQRRPCTGARNIAELDPVRIFNSRWISTTEREWRTSEFVLLKQDIYATEGNVQPIKVRPAEGTVVTGCLSDEAEATTKFEIVFGHLRHRACLELGLPVLCMVESVHDAQLVKEFIVENLRRLPWRAWQLGEVCRRALDDGLFHSVRRLSQDTSLDLDEACLLIELARLPKCVQDKFDWVEMTRSLAKELVAAYARDHELMNRNAEQSDFTSCRTARAVLRELTWATR